jgi:excisionase family DNA binding protein
MTKKLLTVDGLSNYLSMPKPTIYTWVCLRKIPQPCVVKLGRALRFDVGEIDKWVNGQRASEGCRI